MPWSMALIAAVIGLPMFFEVGLVLLVPIIVVMAKRTNTPRVLLAVPALAGLGTMHAFVPPHPGPLVAVSALRPTSAPHWAWICSRRPHRDHPGPPVREVHRAPCEQRGPGGARRPPSSRSRRGRGAGAARRTARLHRPPSVWSPCPSCSMLAKSVADIAFPGRRLVRPPAGLPRHTAHRDVRRRARRHGRLRIPARPQPRGGPHRRHRRAAGRRRHPAHRRCGRRLQADHRGHRRGRRHRQVRRRGATCRCSSSAGCSQC